MKKFLLICIAALICSCNPKLFKEKWVKEQAPTTFKARFETTKGNFDILSIRSNSPEGIDRLYQLIKRGFYTNIAIYRVVPNFVVQFGIHNDSLINTKWREYKIPDEKVLQSNDSMTLSFARGGIETRSTQLFINIKDNKRLDKLTYSGVEGFPVVAKVTNGMEIVHQFYSGYGERPAKKQRQINSLGNDFLRKEYPELDYITKAYIIK